MKFSDDDMADMLDAVGLVATAPGGTFSVIPPQPQQVALHGDGIMEAARFAVTAESVITELSILAGETGTIINIDDLPYRVLSIEPDGDGFVSMMLGSV